MVRSRIIPLIALVLRCGVLRNGCVTHSRLPGEGEERLIQQHSGAALFPMGYVTSAGTKDLVSPEWVKRGMKRGAEVGAIGF